MVLTTGQITIGNLYRQAYANLFNLINNKVNVPDPLSTYNSTRQMVYSRQPDIGTGFEGYPLIIVGNMAVSTEEENLANTTAMVPSDFVIEVHCTDRIRKKEGSGEEVQGLIYVEQLSTDIFETLLNKGNRAKLKLDGLGRMELSADSAVPTYNDAGDLMWVRTIRISFRDRMVVS